MTSFIRPIPNHWKVTDFDLSSISLDPSILHIAKTVCLLESRCDDYASYLRAIFSQRDPGWNQAIDQWNSEECQHGDVLRAVCESADPNFQFENLMTDYESLVSYHTPTGVSVRGSVGAEMVSRCVVEALASTLYRVLADRIADPNVRTVFSALAQDEARHYGMFLKMLRTEAENENNLGVIARCKYSLKRMLELEDAQITVASCVVAGRSKRTIHQRREANAYLRELYRLYRWKHLRYAVQMLLRTLEVRPSRIIAVPCTELLWLGIKTRLAWAIAGNTIFPPR